MTLDRTQAITYCINCDNVAEDSRKRDPWYWLCTKHPRLEGFGFVTNTTWDRAPPYLRCVDCNGGACPLYKERKSDAER